MFFRSRKITYRLQKCTASLISFGFHAKLREVSVLLKFYSMFFMKIIGNMEIIRLESMTVWSLLYDRLRWNLCSKDQNRLQNYVTPEPLFNKILIVYLIYNLLNFILLLLIFDNLPILRYDWNIPLLFVEG